MSRDTWIAIGGGCIATVIASMFVHPLLAVVFGLQGMIVTAGILTAVQHRRRQCFHYHPSPAPGWREGQDGTACGRRLGADPPVGG